MLLKTFATNVWLSSKPILLTNENKNEIEKFDEISKITL
jgi:hypothetical protein